MRAFSAVFVFVLFSMLANSAMADEIWVCAFSGADANKPLMLRLAVKSNFLIDEKANQTYKILKNNQYGLVATSSVSDIEPNETKPTVGASTIVINKQTGEFLSANVILGEPMNEFVRGTCSK